MTDPDSRRYCICNDIAYSKMIGCDNNKVIIIIRVIKIYIYILGWSLKLKINISTAPPSNLKLNYKKIISIIL